MNQQTAAAYAENQNNPFPSVQNQPVSAFMGLLGGRGHIEILRDPSWLAPLMALHERVRDEMPEKAKKFLMARDAAYYRALLSGAAGCILGAVQQGRLIGMLAVVLSSDFAAAKAAGCVTYPDADGIVAQGCGGARVAVLQSLCLVRDAAGQGHSHALIAAGVKWAEHQGVAHIFAQTATENSLCWLKFLERDFAIMGVWKTGHGRYLLKWGGAAQRKRKILLAGHESGLCLARDYALLPPLVLAFVSRMPKGNGLLLDRADSESLRFVAVSV